LPGKKQHHSAIYAEHIHKENVLHHPYYFDICYSLRISTEGIGVVQTTVVPELVLLFASLLTIPLARQSCFDATLFAGFQVVGVTLDFLDDVLLLYLPLESA
jgi:hypothetical protein